VKSATCDPAPSARRSHLTACYKGEFVLESILSFIAGVTVFFRSRSDTALEVLALRQHVAVLKRKRPRPVLNSLDRLFWTALRHFWSRWADVLVIVKPRDRDRLAPRRLPSLLALAIPATRWPTQDHRGDWGSDPSPGAREPGLGSPQDSRRASEAGIRRLRAERGALSATCPAPRRPG
jgi:hypothetical protein